jgi:hypothetical protein
MAIPAKSPQLVAPSPSLPPDLDRVRVAMSACRHHIDEASASLDKFRADWFREDPPRTGEAREDASGVELAALQLVESARTLLRLTEPHRK